MIDAHSALRSYLIAASPLRTLLGGDFVYWPEVPGGGDPAMPGKAISFRFGPGFTFPTLAAQDADARFRCFGSTALQAMDVYRALRDRLHGRQNFIVGTVGFHGANELGPGEPLEDPATGWPYVFVRYSIRVATIPLPSA